MKRLSPKTIKGILTLFATTSLSQSSVSRVFNVAKSTVNAYLSLYKSSDLSFADIGAMSDKEITAALRHNRGARGTLYASTQMSFQSLNTSLSGFVLSGRLSEVESGKYSIKPSTLQAVTSLAYFLGNVFSETFRAPGKKSVLLRTKDNVVVVEEADEKEDEPGGAGPNLSAVDLSYAPLNKTNLAKANLSRSNLAYAALDGADLREASLEGANLRGANLRGANLRRSNLSRVNLAGANLEASDLTEANLQDVNLEGANLRGAVINETIFKG